MSTTDRLSSLDVAFLCLEGAAPMHLGAVLVLGPSAPGTPQSVADALARRASRIARLQLRVQPTWWPPGSAVWAPAPDFHAGDHVRVHELRGGGWPDLVEVTGRLLSRPLDLRQPPWELHVIGGLPAGRVAVAAKLHHALCDGQGAVLLGSGLLDGGCGDEPVRAQPAAQRTAAGPEDWAGRMLTGATRLVDDLPELAEQLGRAAGIGLSVLRHVRQPLAESSLSSDDSARRRLLMLRLDGHDLRRVRRAHGGTTHDVLLTVLAGGLRHWLQTIGHAAGDRSIRAFVPVSRRARASGGGAGNQLSGYLCDLPVGEPDPVRRLRAVRAAMDRNKAAGPGRGPGALGLLAAAAPPAVHRVLTPLAGRHPSLLFDLVVTTVRLPSARLTLGGAPIESVYPLVPLAPGQALGVAFIHDGDTVHVGLHAHAGGRHDAGKLGDALQAALAELAELAEPAALAEPAG